MKGIIPTSPDGNLDTHFGGQVLIYVPPKVEVQIRPDPEGPIEMIGYPVPDIWRKHGIPTWSSPTEALEKKGWTLKTNTDGLISDLGKIADDKSTLNDLKYFVLKWGPLWNCRKHTSVARDQHCFWTFDGYEDRGISKDEMCGWIPADLAEDLRYRAKEIRAAFGIYEYLKEDKPAPLHYWNDWTIPKGRKEFHARFGYSRGNISAQQTIFTSTL